MGRCSVLGCQSKKDAKESGVSFHTRKAINLTMKSAMSLKQGSTASDFTANTLLTRSRPIIDLVQAPVTASQGLTSSVSPDDFINFLPWACGQFNLEKNICVVRIFQAEYVSAANLKIKRAKNKMRQTSTTTITSASEQTTQMSEKRFSLVGDSLTIKAVYSRTENTLIELRIENQDTVPRGVFKLINMIIKYHPSLTAIYINRGLTQYVIHELAGLICTSNITQICFDGAFVDQANYHILLDGPNSLNDLSLERCSIDDDVVEIIASKLADPTPGSKTLILLNLGSNMITDIGVKHLVQALRSNRKIEYLNLAGNLISDEGALALLNVLIEFKLTDEEVNASNGKFMEYYRKRQKLIDILYTEIKENAEWNKTMSKTKTSPKTLKKKKSGISQTQLSADRGLFLTANMGVNPKEDDLYFAARERATELMGVYNHPFNKANTILIQDDGKYCLGNNVLCYLNLSYTYITVRTLAKMIDVLETQKANVRQPRGLIRVKVEGNRYPEHCPELAEIDYLFESHFDKKQSIASPKKRTQSIVK